MIDRKSVHVVGYLDVVQEELLNQNDYYFLL